MIPRVKDANGVVHFRHPTVAGLCLCGGKAAEHDLTLFTAMGLENHKYTARQVPMKPTAEPVNCPNCAVVFCALKNQPWGGGVFADGILEAAIEVNANHEDLEND